MTSHGSVAAKVRREKDAHPERFCNHGKCLWRLASGPCRKHGVTEAPTTIDLMERLQASLAQNGSFRNTDAGRARPDLAEAMDRVARDTSGAAGSGDTPARAKKPGKREPWRCLYCGDVLLIKDNCRKADCLEKYNAARRRMGLSVDAETPL